jgi:hypothetical protein
VKQVSESTRWTADVGRLRVYGASIREIYYKKIDIQESSVPFLRTATAILLNKIRLVAVVPGNKVNNPLSVWEPVGGSAIH